MTKPFKRDIHDGNLVIIALEYRHYELLTEIDEIQNNSVRGPRGPRFYMSVQQLDRAIATELSEFLKTRDRLRDLKKDIENGN